MDLGLRGRTFIVTGASGGIGQNIVKILADEGANIIIHYNSNKESADQLSDDVHRYNVETIVIQANLKDEQSVKEMFRSAINKFGKIDGLVNNAGIWPAEDVSLADMTLERWENTLRVNLTSIFLCTKEFMNLLKTQNQETASVVLIGSTAAIFGEANHIDYSSSKAALEGFMLTLKNEIVRYSRHGRVNMISPGWTKTSMAKEGLKNKVAVTRVLQTMAMRKIATANDIARSVVYLLSDKMSYHVSGQNIVVAGGMEGRLLYEKDEVDPNDVVKEV